jgi:hypothetical protein
MPLFCARLLVVCLVDDERPKKRNICDYPFVLLEATDHDGAFAKALELGKKQETKYRNSKRQLVRWAFVKVEQITQLEDSLDGQEVGSLLDVLRTDEPLGYRKRFSPGKSKPVQS